MISFRPGKVSKFLTSGTQADDAEAANVYGRSGAEIGKLDAATVSMWRDIARDTAWKDYSAKTATAAKLLKLASEVGA